MFRDVAEPSFMAKRAVLARREEEKFLRELELYDLLPER